MRVPPFIALVSEHIGPIFGLKKIREDPGIGSLLVVEVELSDRQG